MSISTFSAAWRATCSSPPSSIWRRTSSRKLKMFCGAAEGCSKGFPAALRSTTTECSSDAGSSSSARTRDNETQNHHSHAHADWRLIRSELEDSDLERTVKRHAIGIFSLLAEAEARVHGCAVELALFHELGAWDSIADIVAVAHVIEAIAASNWTVSPIALGSGRVETAHGVPPCPRAGDGSASGRLRDRR